MQRVAADISARLAQIAKDPPDLGAYFRLHAECIVHTLHPVGLAYEMLAGPNFQRAFAHNYESLQLREAPAQETAFQRAVRSTAEQGRPVFLDAKSIPSEFLRGLNPEDAPAPETLPLHNQTPFQHIFVPIPTNKKTVGVLHSWFAPADAPTSQARATLLGHAAGEMELYLKARRSSDVTQELTRVTTYASFLEDVAGDQDLESVSWKLVNYAREAVGCERVCLFIDSRYGLAVTQGLPPSDSFALQACSGLRQPHQRSEHADVLKNHAAELLKLAVGAAEPPRPVAPTPATNGSNGASAPSENGETEAAASASAEPGDEKADSESQPAQPAPEKRPAEGRPRMRIIFTHRDPSKTDSRPDAVNHYFDEIPMNWSTVLPLYDRNNVVCGTLLFEGQHTDEKTVTLFNQMRDLAVSGGRALSTALVWGRRRTLRFARVLMRWRDSLYGTSRRRIALKFGVPVALVIGLLAFPFPYRIGGDATMRPANVETVAALTTGRLMEVNAREGDEVKKGQILCVLDSSDLELQLRQAEQERERSLTEASLALHQERSEMRMQIARLAAEKAATTAAKLRLDIEHTVIRAPFDGILVGPQDFTQRRGQVIRSGEPVAEVADPSQWEVRVNVREEDVPRLVDQVNKIRAHDPQAGVPGKVVLAANPNDVYHIELKDPEAFANRLDTSGGKYDFSAVIPMDEKVAGEGDAANVQLKDGYTGRVKFSCGHEPLIGILFGDFVRFLKVYLF